MVRKQPNLPGMPRNRRSPRRPNHRGAKVQFLAEERAFLAEERALPFLEYRVPNLISRAPAGEFDLANLPAEVKFTCWSSGNEIRHSVFDERERHLFGIAL